MVNQRKRDIVSRLCECFTSYKQITVVSLDNVSTNQIHAARAILQSGEHKGEMIIGKNTLIKKALKFKTEAPNPSSDDYEDHKNHTQDPKLTALIPLMKLNVGLIFSEEPYMELRTKVEAEKIKMPARTGIPAPCDVVLPVGPTGVEVGKIDLFQNSTSSVRPSSQLSKSIRRLKLSPKEKRLLKVQPRCVSCCRLCPSSTPCLSNTSTLMELSLINQSLRCHWTISPVPSNHTPDS